MKTCGRFSNLGQKIGTLEFLNKKHLIFGQGLDFLKYRQGNRGENEQNGRNNLENPRRTRKIQENSIRNLEIEILISYYFLKKLFSVGEYLKTCGRFSNLGEKIGNLEVGFGGF